MSLHGIQCQKAKPTDRPSLYKSGTIYINPDPKRNVATTSALVYGKKKSLYQDLNTTVMNIASDVVFAYPETCGGTTDCLQLDQVYGLASSNLIVKPLGKWVGLPAPFVLTPSEHRKANKNTFIRVGIKNSTSIAVSEDDVPVSLTTLAEKEEEIHLISLLRVIFTAMNISYDLIEFPKLGWRNDEDTWTHMLGAIADGSVQVAADTVDLSTEGVRNHMILTNPIIRTLSAVYLQRPEGVHLRDVLLGTFSLPLMVSVLLTSLLLWIAMLTVTVFTSKRALSDDREYEPSEALLWIVSVICMQGSPWSPQTLSGCILLIFSLIFALITYNSFAAFITSLLSVNDNPFRSLDDLLKTDVTFGYIQESPEEHFLRGVDEASLRTLYYRSLVGGGGMDDVASGMTRAAGNHYAFFATARLARRTLQSQISSKWRCRILEMPVDSTKTTAAIPMAISSPYNPLIHYWLIRIREAGILSRIRISLLPPMPSCITGQQFHGATLGDLKTAFGALFIGLIAAPIILIFEIFSARKWPPKKRMPRRNARMPGGISKVHWGLNEYLN